MRLAFLKRGFGQPGGGGSEANCNRLARAVVDRGHELHVFSDVESHCNHPKLALHPVKAHRHPGFLGVIEFDRATARAVRRHARGQGPFDAVVGFGKTTCHDVYLADGGVHRRFMRTRRFPTLQRYLNPLQQVLLRIEDRIFAPDHPTHIVTNSRMVRGELMEEYGLPESKFTVVYNGIELDRFSPERRGTDRAAIRDRHGIAENDVVLLFVGTGWERKGLDVLVRALPLLLAEAPEVSWKVCVIGRGNERKYRRIAAKAGLDAEDIDKRLILAGYRSDAECYYAAADIFVLPTRYDSGAHVIGESMASALPTISTSTNGTSELIEPEFGGVIDGHRLDPAELSCVVRRFATSDARQRAGALARAGARNFTMARHVDETLEVYARVAEAKRLAGK